MKLAVMGGFGTLIPSLCHRASLPGNPAKGFSIDFQAEKTATNKLFVYSVSISFSRNGSLPTRKIPALQ